MSPNPQGLVNDAENMEIRKPVSELNGDEIVISGISGNFPRSDNIQEFMDNLYNNVDMVTLNEEKWQLNHPHIARHLGKVNGLNKFDAQFFGVPHGQSNQMDPMARKLMENAYGALFDAGVNPKSVAGTRLGVFSGASFTDIGGLNMFEAQNNNNYMMIGSSKTMMANRISYWLDTKGPSYSIDATCGSSMTALDHAYKAIKDGTCSSALVAGSNLCMHPILTLNLRRAGFLCVDGKTKCFDKNADGYVRSDAVGVIFLQKASEAKRVYAEIVHLKGKYFTKSDSDFMTFRKSDDIVEFLRDFYSEVNVSPKEIEYLEAFGAGTRAADENELEAVSQFYAKNGTIIKIGCVKSNMGHSEGAADICALTKACLAYHKGQLPANLHYQAPMDHIDAVKDGRIQVITTTTPFRRGYTAINSFSYTGCNQHVLIKGHYKEKDLKRYDSSIPRLVLASGRVDTSISRIVDSLKSNPLDAEQIALLHDFFAFDISGHTSRGYVILDTNENNETIALAESVDLYPGTKAPVWFLYSGMGSQWPGMGAELMRIPLFAASIKRSHKVLEPKNIDLINIITSEDESMFDNILHSFVGIAAIQIALTDLLREMGIVPHNIIGHSVGELGCAYADGSLTAEEVMLSSYTRGLVSIETKFIDGLMAAVGLGHAKVSSICPPEIAVACHNSSESSTISGPADIVRKFIEDLQAQNIFAKEVQTANIAYHSKYISEAAPRFLSTMEEIVKVPKLRSEKWICTSAPPEEWNRPSTMYASAEYFVNNFLNSVYFEEAAKKIPVNSTIIEIAPHGLMQAIMMKSHKTCTHVPLTRRGHSDTVRFFLEAVGKLYLNGLNPKIDCLYPKVEYPVSTETPLLSPLVGWAHIEEWKTTTYNKQETTRQSARNFAMTINDDDWDYLKGHVRNGATIFPEAALLVLVWETLAMYKGLNYRELPVTFKDIRFEKELYIRGNEVLRFTIEIQMGCCRFEINNEGSIIASGFIRDEEVPSIDPDYIETNVIDDVVLTLKDIYKLLEVRGFSYTGEFRTVLSSNTKCNAANIMWTNEWITFLDSLIQLNILNRNHDGISIPKFIRRLLIDTKSHKTDGVTMLNAYYDSILDSTRCGGVQIDNITFKDKAILEKESNILEIRTFVPHLHATPTDLKTALTINLQIIKENIPEECIKITELILKSKSGTQKNTMNEVIDIISKFQIDYLKIYPDDLVDQISQEYIFGNSHLYIIYNTLHDEKMMEKIFHSLRNNTFILTIESKQCDSNLDEVRNFKVITCLTVGNLKMILLRKIEDVVKISYIEVKHDNKFSWVPRVRRELDDAKRVMLVSERTELSGLIRFVQALRKDGITNIGVVLPKKSNKEERFNPKLPLHIKQIEKNLTYNIFEKNHWGNYYYLPNEEPNVGQKVVLINKYSGSIDGLAWEEFPVGPFNKNLVQVSYTGLSLYDCQKTTGKNTNESKTFGMDFSGHNASGARVMGLVSSGALGNTVESDPTLLWPVPKHWNLQDAATVPLPYVHAYYCLTVRNNLEKDNTVLVLGGAGALGQAVISICLDYNCTVFVIVSNKEKKRFLLKIFPKLKEEHIISSSSEYQDINSLISYFTNYKFCKFVVSCAGGKSRMCAMQCVGAFGTFVDVSNNDKEENMEFGLNYLMKGRNYNSVSLSSIFKPENYNQKKVLHGFVSDGIARGVVRPLNRAIYSPCDISRAFRFVSSTQRTGRVLINMEAVMTSKDQLEITARSSFSPEASFIVISDENILGVELAGWLIKRGVRRVVLHQKNNSSVSYLNAKRESWKKLGVLSATSVEDLETNAGCKKMLSITEKLGPIQGIFIVQASETNFKVDHKSLEETFADEFKQKLMAVSNLDEESRKSCLQLRHFVVISSSTDSLSDNFALSAIENICDDRYKDQYPSLIMHTDFYKKNSNSKVTMPEKLSEFFNSLDKSLKYKYNNVMHSHVQNYLEPECMETISKIIGIPNNKTIEETETLKSFKLTEERLSEIRLYLNKHFEIDYTTEELQRISIAELMKISTRTLKNKQPSRDGLRAFYNCIEQDEIAAATSIVIMPSKIDSCTDKVPEELDPTETHLIMIPGFEGHCRIFSNIGERLKIQAATLQLSPDLEGDSIPQMAANLLKHISESFKFTSKFYIMGYSFGVNIALELAALLEKKGYSGVVYCLDSSPDANKVHLNTYLGCQTESELQNLIITEIYNLMTGNDDDDMKKEINNLDNWSAKVDYCLKKLQNTVASSHEYQKAVIESTYKRIMLAKAYEPEFKLKSKIVLLKGVPNPQGETLAEDYNLSKYTKQAITVFDIASDHVSAPYDSAVSNIVNKMLEPKILEEYKTKNLCEIRSKVPVWVQISEISALRVPTKKKDPNFIV